MASNTQTQTHTAAGMSETLRSDGEVHPDELGDGVMDAQAPARCFSRSPDLSFDDAVRGLLSLTELPPGRPDLAEYIPNADDSEDVIRFVRSELLVVKQRPSVVNLCATCSLTDEDLCALICFKLELPYPVYRWLNGWMQSNRRDRTVQTKVGPLFKLIYRAMEKLPMVTTRAARAVVVGNIPALRSTFNNYQTRLAEGKEISFWSLASFSTSDNVIENPAFVGGVNDPAIVYMCAPLEGVDMEPFHPRGLPLEHEVLPLCPAVFKIHVAGRIGAKIVATVVQDVVRHSELAYVPPRRQLPASPAVVKIVPSPLPDVSEEDKELEMPPSDIRDRLVTEMTNIKKYPVSSSLGTTVVGNGMTWNDAAVFLVDPTATPQQQSVGFWALGRTAEREVSLVSGVKMSQQQCYLEAIARDDRSSNAYYSLGLSLKVGATVTLMDGRVLTKLQCYLETIARDDGNSNAYNNIGVLLNAAAGETITLPDGRSLSRQGCFLEAIARDDRNSVAFNSLGTSLTRTETVTLRDQRSFTQVQCFVEAIAHDDRNSNAYMNLGNALRAGETVLLKDGRSLSQQSCYIEAIARRNERSSSAFICLGKTLIGGSSSTLKDGRSFNQQQCFIEAIACNPRDAFAFMNLAQSIPEDQDRKRVTLPDGRQLTRLQLLMEAKELQTKR